MTRIPKPSDPTQYYTATYDAYGKSTVLTGAYAPRASTSYDWEYRFTGRRLDSETGLYYYRNRYYDFQLGEFLRRDSLSYTNGPNLHRAYFVPNTTDPWGMWIFPMPWPVVPPTTGPGGLPGEVDNLWPMDSDGCERCTRGGLERALRAIQEAIDDAWAFPFWPEHCQRWVFDFERHLPGGFSARAACIKHAGGHRESSGSIGSGHAVYSFTLCDGTIIRVDNGNTTGDDHYEIIEPPKADGRFQ